MTTIATGGFSNYNQSIGFFNSIAIETSAMVFIILGSLPFIVYIKFINGNRSIFSSDTQIKTFFKIILISIIILSAYLFINDLDSFNLRSIIFNTISILTGTGYVNAQFDTWGGFPLILFLVLNSIRKVKLKLLIALEQSSLFYDQFFLLDKVFEFDQLEEPTSN